MEAEREKFKQTGWWFRLSRWLNGRASDAFAGVPGSIFSWGVSDFFCFCQRFTSNFPFSFPSSSFPFPSPFNLSFVLKASQRYTNDFSLLFFLISNIKKTISKSFSFFNCNISPVHSPFRSPALHRLIALRWLETLLRWMSVQCWVCPYCIMTLGRCRTLHGWKTRHRWTTHRLFVDFSR